MAQWLSICQVHASGQYCCTSLFILACIFLKDVCKPWILAREWTNARIHMKWSPELHELTGDTKAFLAALPWDNEPVCVMWRYLGPHMTMSSQQNDMLDNLSDRIAAQQHLAGIMGWH